MHPTAFCLLGRAQSTAVRPAVCCFLEVRWRGFALLANPVVGACTSAQNLGCCVGQHQCCVAHSLAVVCCAVACVLATGHYMCIVGFLFTCGVWHDRSSACLDVQLWPAVLVCCWLRLRAATKQHHVCAVCDVKSLSACVARQALLLGGYY